MSLSCKNGLVCQREVFVTRLNEYGVTETKVNFYLAFRFARINILKHLIVDLRLICN